MDGTLKQTLGYSFALRQAQIINSYWAERGYNAEALPFLRPAQHWNDGKTYMTAQGKMELLPTFVGQEWSVTTNMINGIPTKRLIRQA